MKVEINATAKKAAWFWETPKKLAASFAFEDEFHKAYDACVDGLPWLTSSAEKAKAGRKAGYDVIYNGFMDGTIKTSMPGNPSYVEWYGKMWDDHARQRRRRRRSLPLYRTPPARTRLSMARRPRQRPPSRVPRARSQKAEISEWIRQRNSWPRTWRPSSRPRRRNSGTRSRLSRLWPLTFSATMQIGRAHV